MKKELIAFYLDFTNNFITASHMADFYEMKKEDCLTLIKLGCNYYLESINYDKL